MTKGCYLKIVRSIFFAALVMVPLSVPTFASGPDYREVFKLFKACSLLGMKIEGTMLIRDECKTIFKETFLRKNQDTVTSFNDLWARAGGEAALTQTPKIQTGLLGNNYNLTGGQANSRTSLFEELSPNWIGQRKLDEAAQRISYLFEQMHPLVYSQLTKCFSKMHDNARLLRELASKRNYLKSGKPNFSDRDLVLMHKSSIFSASDIDACEALDSAVSRALPDLIKNFKSEVATSTPAKRECKSFKHYLSNSDFFYTYEHSVVCADHYEHNLKRVLPVARKIMSDIEEAEESKNQTSTEQLIK